MFDRIIHFSIYNRVIIIILLAGWTLWGVNSLMHLPIDAVPDITDNQVQIITSSPDLSAQEIERFITFPLELEMGNIPDVDEIRSISRFGLSVITIVFKENVDVYWAREQINQKIQNAKKDIPESYGSPEMGPISTGLGEIYQYVLYPEDGYEDQFTSTDLRSIQDWIIRRQIIGLPGVVEVNSSGGYLKQYEISIDPEKLASFELSLAEIFSAVGSNNANSGGSYIERANQTYFIRGEGLARSVEDLNKIMVKFDGDIPILLQDVATVSIGHAPRFGAVTMNGKGEVVAGQVMMLKGANSNDVTNLVKERIEAIKPTLPEGVVIEPYLDRSKLVKNTTKTVMTNLLEGALIVIFILVMLLGNFRAGLIVASVIPLSMLFAVSMMQLFGVSANLMSLGALDFGLIVDGAVIIVEAILHTLGKRNKKDRLTVGQQKDVVYEAASKIRTSAAFGEIIILVVYLPILFLRGVEGKMFIPMAQTVSFAILGALILSLTYVPMMSATFLRGTVERRDSLSTKIINWFYKMYAPVRDLAMRMKAFTIGSTVLMFGVSMWLMSQMGSEFIPTLDEGDFALHQILPSGSSIKKGVEVSANLQEILMENFPEVEKVVTKIGTAEIPTDIMPLEAGDIYVIMKPKSEWTSADTREEMFEKMEEELNKFPGVMYEFTQPIQMRFNELMTGVRQDIAIKIYGEDLGILVEKAHDAESILETINGVGDIQVEPTSGLQQMVVDYDRIAIARYGLSIENLNDIIKTAFAGKKAGVFFEGEKRFDIVVRLAEHHRVGIESLQSLRVLTPQGALVPMSELARIAYEEGPAQISRDDTKRRITLGVNTRNRDIASVISDIKSEFSEKLDLPPGYYVRYGGQFENLERARGRLAIVVPIALGIIFLLLYFTFGSVKYAVLIYTAIPLSAVGGIWALYLRGMPFSISAGIGFIALFGVAVLNGIVLVSYFNQLKREGMKDINEIIVEGTKVRLRPVIMTAMVASFGFLPMAISTTAGAEVQRPLATVVIGGLITATMLTLLVIPILYWWLEKIKKPRSLKTITLLVGLFSFGITNGQTSISIKDALSLVEAENHPINVTGDLNRDAYLLQAENPIPPSPLGISFSGEEFQFDGNSGVQSLNLQKQFRLPKVGKAYSNYYQELSKGADITTSLNILNLKHRVAETYINAAHIKAVMEIEIIRRRAYTDLREVSDRNAQLGQSSNLSTRQAAAQLSLIDLIISELEVTYNQYVGTLNTFLGGEDYDVTTLSMTDLSSDDILVDSHPLISKAEQDKSILAAHLETVKSENLPKIIGGIKLQSLGGDLLYYGYNLGLSIPLSSSYHKSMKQAAQLRSQSIDVNSIWFRDQLEKKKVVMNERKHWLLQSTSALDEQISLQEEILKDLEKAFRFGEASYAEVVLGQENLYESKLKKLIIIKDYLLDVNNTLHLLK